MYKVYVTELADKEVSAWNDIVAVLKSVRSKVKAVMKSDNIKIITWDKLYETTQEDPVMVRLV
jgi:hypothetical protein